MKFTKLTELFKGDKKLRIVMILGICGIVLIGITSFFPTKSAIKEKVSGDKSIEEYKMEFEAEITELLGTIKGVGKVKVMVTFKNGVEYLYAKEEKQNTDSTNGIGGNEQSVQQRDTYEQTTIMVEDENGRKSALIRTRLEPVVKGVVIVCEGGDDVIIQQKVTEAVKVALSIGTNQISCIR